MRGRCWEVSLVLFAALLGVFLVASPAFAKATSDDTSFGATLENLAATVKAKSEKALAAALKAAEDGKTDMAEVMADLAEVKTRVSARLVSWREALSERKAELATFGRDATASLERWRQSAGHAVTAMQRSAADALDRFAEWMREQSGPAERAKTRV